jgi:hypothetical protein
VAHRVRWIEQDEGRIGGLTEVGLHECVNESLESRVCLAAYALQGIPEQDPPYMVLVGKEIS